MSFDTESSAGWVGDFNSMDFNLSGPTATPSATGTATQTPAATNTPTQTAAATPSRTPTNTSLVTNTSTQTPTPSYTPTQTATPSITPTPPGAFSSASFSYDGDGRRVKSVIGSETTLFVGAHYEVTNPGSGQTITKYYFAGAQRIAVRKYTIPQNMTVEYIISDHLGSTSIVTDENGAKVSELRYKAWGEVRYSSGNTPTKYQYTSQFSYTAEFGLLFYNARMYDPAMGRFTSADAIVPQGIQGLDRYAYVNNSPLNYVDPSGHLSEKEICENWGISECTKENIQKELGNGLFNILYNTDITWGDTIAFGDANGAELKAVLLKVVAFGPDRDKTVSPGLLNTETGDVITNWDSVKDYDRMAGHNQAHDKWSTWDKNSADWGSDKAALEWAGQLQSYYDGTGLSLNGRWKNYTLNTETDRDYWWYATTGGALVFTIGGIYIKPLWIPAAVLWVYQVGADNGLWLGPTPPKNWVRRPYAEYDCSTIDIFGPYYSPVCP